MARVAYTKSKLIKELAEKSGITKAVSQSVLQSLTEIIYREAAADGFVLPGVCKFYVADRAARKIRNPRTGEMFMMPACKQLRTTISKFAKDAIAPRPTPVPYVEENVPAAAAPVAEETPAVAEAPVAPPVAEDKPAVEAAGVVEVSAPAPTPAPESTLVSAPAPAPAPEPAPESASGSESEDVPEGTKFVSFLCPGCNQEIEAPEDMCGSEAECPNCGATFEIPFYSEAGTIHDEAAAKEREQKRVEAQKHSTMRIDLDDF